MEGKGRKRVIMISTHNVAGGGTEKAVHTEKTRMIL